MFGANIFGHIWTWKNPKSMNERQKNPVCSAKIQFPMLSDRTLMETIVQ